MTFQKEDWLAAAAFLGVPVVVALILWERREQ